MEMTYAEKRKFAAARRRWRRAEYLQQMADDSAKAEKLAREDPGYAYIPPKRLDEELFGFKLF